MPNVPYNKTLKQHSRDLRNESTLAEILLWKYLRAKQMKGYQFNRQKPIKNFIVDFYCKPLALVIEIDGSSHTQEKYTYDMKREQTLKELGLTVLRFSEHDVRHDMRNVIEAIEGWIEKRERREID